MDLRFDRKRQPQHDEALRGIQPVGDPMMEPPPSEKHCKIEVLNIVGLQMISVILRSYDDELIGNLLFKIRISSKKTIAY